jgi:hypothetical protein
MIPLLAFTVVFFRWVAAEAEDEQEHSSDRSLSARIKSS